MAERNGMICPATISIFRSVSVPFRLRDRRYLLLNAGWARMQGEIDTAVVSFGPHGTAGWHVFNTSHPIHTRIAGLSRIRQSFKPLRRGRQYPREISYLDYQST